MKKIKVFLAKSIKYIYREIFLHLIWYFSSYFPLFPTIMFTKIRAFTWKILGVRIGKNVQINYGIYLDVPSASRLTIEDNVLIAAECLFLLHKRDMSQYDGIILQNKLPMKEGYIKICKNASLGSRTVIMPNVTIGEGAVIGANSTVTKDIPPFAIAIGNPAKVVKYVKNNNKDYIEIEKQYK